MTEEVERHSGSGKWRRLGVPHRGWDCVGYEDLGPDEDDFVTCEMCEMAEIRHVHTMSHPDYPQALEVGCVCAENMSGDYVGPRRRERELRLRVKRRERQARREQDELRQREQYELWRQQEELRHRQRPEVIAALNCVKAVDEILAHGGLSVEEDTFVRGLRAIAEYNAAPRTIFQCKFLPKQVKGLSDLYERIPIEQRTAAAKEERKFDVVE
jgi:hypothetical protein